MNLVLCHHPGWVGPKLAMSAPLEYLRTAARPLRRHCRTMAPRDGPRPLLQCAHWPPAIPHSEDRRIWVGHFAGKSHHLVPHALTQAFSHRSRGLPTQFLGERWHGAETARYKQAASWLHRLLCYRSALPTKAEIATSNPCAGTLGQNTVGPRRTLPTQHPAPCPSM